MRRRTGGERSGRGKKRKRTGGERGGKERGGKGEEVKEAQNLYKVSTPEVLVFQSNPQA